MLWFNWSEIQRYLLSILIPSGVGFLNALRPRINPIPPERLLITAAVTASCRSLSPEAPPELIRPPCNSWRLGIYSILMGCPQLIFHKRVYQFFQNLNQENLY